MTSSTTSGPPPMRVAFYGRVACGSPSADLGLARQHERCRRALPPHSINAVFYDVGSSPFARPQRVPGRLTVHSDTEVVRGGGLADLLAEATVVTRRFDYLITCGPDRLSSDPQRALELMDQLEQASVYYAFPAGDGQILTPFLIWPLAHLAGIRAWRPTEDGDPR